MPTTVKIRRSGTASATPSALEHGEIAINYADGKVFWKNASNVITSFTFQSYALASHTHAASDITSGTLDAARLPLATTGAAGAVIVGTGLGVSSGTVSVTYGTSSGTACQGNDSRLSDARTPTSHTHGNISNAGAIGSTADQFVVTTTSGVLTAVSAATARTTLSVQPTASPAFTGAAAVTSGSVSVSGSVGSAPANGTSHTVVLTSTATAAVNVGPTVFFKGQTGNSTADYGFGAIQGVKDSSASQNYAGALVFFAQTGGGAGSLSEVMRCRTDASTGAVQTVMAGQCLVTAGSGSSGSYKPGLAISGDDDTGIHQVSGNANTLSIVTNGTERVRVGSAGRFTFFANSEKYGIQLNNGATANGPFIGSDGADIFTISTAGGAERVRVDASGNVGIGTISPPEKLSVFGDNNAGRTSILVDNLDQRLKLSCYYQSGVGQYAEIQAFDNAETGFHNLLLNRQGGDVLIGTATDSGAYKLQVNSQIYATNATIATSDARFKTHVESLTDATSVIESLRPVAFDFIPQENRNFATERQVGLIAQEAQEALAGTDYADSVVAQCGDHLGLAYEKLVPVLIKALQESNARIAALEERLNHA